MTVRGEMEFAYQGEIVTPSRCGRMDQACAYGDKPVIMTYDGEFVDVAEVRVSEPLHFVIVDLRAVKDTVVILRDLQSAFPFAKDEAQRKVQELLGAFNQEVSRQAVECIQQGDKEALGKLMWRAYERFREAGGDICPDELRAPILHKCLMHPTLQPYILGGKGVGAGGDGTAQFLCRSLEDQNAVCDIVVSELNMEPLRLTINPATKIRKAVITAAGFNPANFPAMKAVKTELFPIVKENGSIEPAMLLNVEEILASGIEKVVSFSSYMSIYGNNLDLLPCIRSIFSSSRRTSASFRTFSRRISPRRTSSGSRRARKSRAKGYLTWEPKWISLSKKSRKGSAMRSHSARMLLGTNPFS